MIGAKANWATGVYTGSALQAGKEKWCATCHDEAPSIIQSISAPNVVGDEYGDYTYGTGWGYYKTGHGLPAGETFPSKGGIVTLSGRPVECDSCHDFSTAHIDGLARTFDDGESNTLDPSYYRQGYRLKMVAAGQGTGASTQEPLLVPWPITQPNSDNNYRLCVNCHDSGPFLDSNNTNTNLKSDGVNRHEYHLAVTGFGTRYSSDWSNTACTAGNMSACNSSIICVTCHNVHGSTRLAMVRDGKLIGREPGLKIWYYNPDIVDYISPPDTVPYPQDVPLTASTGTVWSAGSSGNLCSHCHGDNNLSNEFRTPFQNVQQAPTLAWTNENGYESDGVHPDSAAAGSSFIFRVKYTDKNNDAPVAMQLWLDRNNNGVYEDNANPDLDEKIDLTGVVPTDHNYTDGKIYTKTLSVPKRTGENNSIYNYRFYAENSQIATGPPTSEKTVTANNNSPSLSWTGEAYYQNSGVNPVTGGNGSNYEFRIKYTDADNECPSNIQVWIDANDNDNYEEGEKHNMTAADANACSSGRVYTYSTTLAYAGNGDLPYTFRASDGFAQASGDAGPLNNNVVTVLSSADIPPLLEWEAGACRTEGVSPRTGAAGAEFTFLVKYTDLNNSCPASGTSNIQVWIDENDNSTYEESEKYNLTEVDPGDTDCTNGKLYSTTRPLAYAGDGSLTYRFYATDGSLPAIGDPADSDSTVTVVTGVRKVRPTGGSGWYSTIQDAVAASQTILVYPNTDFSPATYNESVLVNTGTDNVTIRSVCGPDYTIIDGAGTGYAVRSNSSNNITVDGFSLTGDANGGYFNGGGTINVSNCKIYGNTGSGILANNGASLSISNCEIYSNGSALLGYGGGLYILQGTHTIGNSTIRNNTSEDGGGLATNNNVTLTITNTTIKDNSATNIGGGIYFNTGTLNMSKSTISGNVSSSGGGGIYMNTSPTVNLENCILTGNSGTEGGMLFISTGTTTITNCTMAENQATAGDGGAIYSNNVPVVVRNSIFWNNTASGTGHNLYKVGDASLNPSTITDSDIITGRPYISNCTVTLENNIADDPLFIGGGDYHLLSISPVIDQANAAYAPSDDIDGDTRPQGAADDMGADEYTTEQEDAEAPVVTGFTVTTPSTNRNVPITLFTATDNVGVTGYRITTSSIPPSAGEGGWSATAPTTYLVTSDGTHILYPWAKDAAGNVSSVFGTPRTVEVDATAPTVTSFTATTPSLSLNIPITSFTATDSVGVTGYQITTNSTPPAAGGGGWSGTAPTTYTVGSDGTYTLYPWAKDAIGNVSAVFATPRTVVVDTTPPTVSSTNPSNGATGVTANSPVTINWSENVDCTTVTTSTITISPSVTWTRTSCSGSQAVFSPSGQSSLTLYTVTVSTSVKDANGNAMASNYQFSYTTAAAFNNAPVLSWATANCLTEGVRPRTGAINANFEFRVKYSDADNQCPTSIQVTVNGTPYDLTDNDGASCLTGRTYYRSIIVGTAGDLNYSFSASDGIDSAAGTPTSNHLVSVINTAYKVRPAGGSGWYSTIQDAINASTDPSTILVYPNSDFTATTYASFVLSTALSTKHNRTVQSVCGADLTIVSGGSDVVSCTNGNAGVVDGFSITGGSSRGVYLSCNDYQTFTLKNSKVYSNTSQGVYALGSCFPVNIESTKIYSNTAGGIYMVNNTSQLNVTGSEIYFNSGATNGAGINIASGNAGTTHTITNTTIRDNSASSYGGAIYCNVCTINIEDSIIRNNTATTYYGGALYCTNTCNLTIDDCTINGNISTNGGAFYFNSNTAAVTIIDTFIQGNEATTGAGGALYVNGGYANLTNVMLTGNKSAGRGGAIYHNNGYTNCTFCTMSGNYAGTQGGGIYLLNNYTSSLKNSIVYNNDAGSPTDANYKQIETNYRWTYMDVYNTLINQAPGSGMGNPRLSYENMGGNLHEGSRTNELPYFVNGLAPASAPTTGGDYRICGGTDTPVLGCANVSWGIDTGSASWTSDHDIFGDPRPLDGPDVDTDAEYDMGADEYMP
ncbi:MAG: Ig-like domain-containing protein [Nitrospirota bacterium]